MFYLNVISSTSQGRPYSPNTDLETVFVISKTVWYSNIEAHYFASSKMIRNAGMLIKFKMF